MSPRLLTIAAGVAGRRTAALIALLLATLMLAPAGASATVTSFTGTDPAGDGSGPAFDVTGGTATYDGTKGTFSVTITTAGSAVGASQMIAGFAGVQSGTNCATDAVDGSVLGWGNLESSALGSQSAWGRPGSDIEGKVTTTRAGSNTTFAMGPDANLKTTNSDSSVKDLSPTCILVSVRELQADDIPAAIGDDFVMFVTAGSTKTGGGDSGPGAVTAAPVPVTTDQPDADRDGIPDTADACPKVPGASATGCPTMPAALEFRLGAKRVVVDRLVALTGTSCPARVIAVVTAKGKRIGKGSLTVGQRGSFCHVTGVIALKHTAKKVRIVGKATGMGSVVKSIKR